LLDFQHFGAPRDMITKSCVWQLDDQIRCVVVDVFAELFKHFDGGAGLSGRRCLRNQMWMPL
jgi:hypothetical protein